MHRAHNGGLRTLALQRGLSLIELMVSLAISMIVMLALITLYVNSNRNSVEQARTSLLIDDGRAAMALMSDDLMHAGFWAGYKPAFQDLTFLTAPPDLDIPASTGFSPPDPCLPYSQWNSRHVLALLAIPVEARTTLPAGCGTAVPQPVADSDVLIVRHARTCEADSAGCGAIAAGRIYLQVARCSRQLSGRARDGANYYLQLAANSPENYARTLLRMGSGTDQVRWIQRMEGDSQAIVSTGQSADTLNLSPVPTGSTRYSLPMKISRNGTSEPWPLLDNDCTTPAPLWEFSSSIYYVALVDGQPTLIKLEQAISGSDVVHTQVTPLVPGIEALRVHLGIDRLRTVGGVATAITEAQARSAIEWDAALPEFTRPANRPDGAVDETVRCQPTCTAEQLRNVVTVTTSVLARTREPVQDHTDSATYCLDADVDATNCLLAINAGTTAHPANFKRFTYSAMTRIHNVADARETP